MKLATTRNAADESHYHHKIPIESHNMEVEMPNVEGGGNRGAAPSGSSSSGSGGARAPRQPNSRDGERAAEEIYKDDKNGMVKDIWDRVRGWF